ncbi:glycosyltransferase [Kineococcus terrestris]|uniref:glycosyltransferase n=1 Tax=Kineococcus terrestris TaxID=2044856 RepID=UPI0034DAD77C
MKVLVVADTYSPDVNGASTFAQRFAAGLAARHEVHVLAPARRWRSGSAVVAVAPGRSLVEHRVRALPVVAGGTGLRFCPPAGLGRAVDAVLRRARPDVVHVQSHFLLGRAAIAAARRAGVRVVATNHFMPENLTHHVPLGAGVERRLHAWAWADAARVFSGADVVTAPTPFAARLAESSGVPGPVLPVSCGLDLSRFSPDADGARRRAFRTRYGVPDRPTFAYVGRLAPEKNVHELVDALALLHGARPELDAQLLLVGDGAERRALLARAARAGVADRVVTTGFVPEEDLPAAYAAADAFVNAGTAELQSLVVLEAMASGLPVLGVAAGALPHLVHEGRNGHLFPHGEPAVLAGRLGALLGPDAAARAARMGRCSREAAAAHDLAATLVRFEELYGALVRPADVRAGSAAAVASAGMAA